MSHSISIAICTYNRSAQLKKTLDAFDRLNDVLGSGDELLIIDNGSQDDTAQASEFFIHSTKLDGVSTRYVFEPEPGLSAARNRALKEFKNEWIIFFDDDVTVNPQTISAYRTAFNVYDSFSFFGGKICVEWGGNRPFWYKPGELALIDGMVGNYDLGSEDREYIRDALLPYGANFAVSATLVERVGTFNTKLGVKGKEVGRGEESDFIFRAMQQNFKGMYLNKASVGHRFQVERISIGHLVKYGMAKGRAPGATDLVDWKREIMSQVLRGMYQLACGRVGNFYQCVVNVGIAYGRRARGS